MKGKVFSSSEVQSIITGNKTQFREVIKVQPEEQLKGYFYLPAGSTGFCESLFILDQCPYKIGQKIFVKESFGADWSNNICYKATDQAEYAVSSWEPASRMKQEQTRVVLEVVNIKIERLAEISKEDAIKEGATSRPNCHGYANIYEGWCMNWNKVGEASKWASNRKTLSESDVCMGSAQYAFGNFWNAAHKKSEHKWEANPFIWVIDFTSRLLTVD